MLCGYAHRRHALPARWLATFYHHPYVLVERRNLPPDVLLRLLRNQGLPQLLSHTNNGRISDVGRLGRLDKPLLLPPHLLGTSLFLPLSPPLPLTPMTLAHSSPHSPPQF